MPCRGVRGATVASTNTREEILAATRELLDALVTANGLQPHDIGAIYFTVTPDLDAAFPAAAARALGWDEVALLDTQAPQVPGDLARCIRVLILWNTGKTAGEVKHVYLGEAGKLRPDRTRGEA